METLALIPARAGSKGVPGKNTCHLAGLPLIAHTIEAALQAGLDPVISTDDPEIARVARAHGARAPFLRPDALATDAAGMLGVVAHACEALSLSPDDTLLCLLQPTSPLRRAEDITGALALYASRARPVVSVTPARKHPAWMYTAHEDGVLEPVWSGPEVARRQDGGRVLALNGALYVLPVSTLLEHETFLPPGVLGYEMPAERSVDIDTPTDWIIAEALFLATTDTGG